MPPNPNAKHGFFGLHVYPNANLQGVMQMAQAGLLASALVISNPDFANDLFRHGVKTVVSRQVFGGSDGLADVRGEQNHDIEEARKLYGNMRGYVTRTDPGVYSQLTNEQNLVSDAYLYQELMRLARADERKLAIFADGGGCPGDTPEGRALYFDVNGNPKSDLLNKRYAAFADAKAGGHLWCWHSYGSITDGKYHRSDELSGLPWFSGRGFEFSRILDAAGIAQPDSIIGEFGSGATQFTQQLGFNEWADNYAKFETLCINKYPDAMKRCRGICAWTYGEVGFPGQDIQQWLPQIIDWQSKR